jgi:hypothetical protein
MDDHGARRLFVYTHRCNRQEKYQQMSVQHTASYQTFFSRQLHVLQATSPTHEQQTQLSQNTPTFSTILPPP